MATEVTLPALGESVTEGRHLDGVGHCVALLPLTGVLVVCG